MSSFRSLFRLIVAVVFYGSLAQPELAAQTVRLATVGKFDAVSQMTLACTQVSGGTWADVPGTVHTFTLGGASRDEVLVSFEANSDLFAIPGSGDVTHLRLVIDDIPQPWRAQGDNRP